MDFSLISSMPLYAKIKRVLLQQKDETGKSIKKKLLFFVFARRTHFTINLSWKFCQHVDRCQWVLGRKENVEENSRQIEYQMLWTILRAPIGPSNFFSMQYLRVSSNLMDGGDQNFGLFLSRMLLYFHIYVYLSVCHRHLGDSYFN